MVRQPDSSLLQEAVGQFVSDAFDEATAKCHAYLIGNQILGRPDAGDADGWFNTVSLGNWLMVAEAAGVPYIPARFLCSVPTTTLYSLLSGLPIPEPLQGHADALTDALHTLETGEMLRFDMCAAASVKGRLSDGCGVGSGWHVHDGVRYPDVDGRLVHAILNYTFDSLPIFARPIEKLRMVEGDVPDFPAGRWPREWRVFIHGGEVVAVSNYYLQAPARPGEAEKAREAVTLAERVLTVLTTAKSWPHHPRYEGVFNTESVSCTLDFAEREDGSLVLVEGGPAHIFSPPWGAHPCCFTPGQPIEGIALALGAAPLPL